MNPGCACDPDLEDRKPFLFLCVCAPTHSDAWHANFGYKR